MTRDLIAVSPSTSIDGAAQLPAGCGISGLPVVDERGVVIGIIAEGDLVEIREGAELYDGSVLGLDEEDDGPVLVRDSTGQRHRVLAGEIRLLD